MGTEVAAPGETRACAMCQEELPKSEFHTRDRGPGATTPYCRSCWTVYKRRRKLAREAGWGGLTARIAAAEAEVAEMREVLRRVKAGLDPANWRHGG